MKGKIHLIHNGHKSYEIFDEDESFIFKMADVFIDKFGFEGKKMPLIGLDGCYMDFYKKHIRITIGWDNWSGCFAMGYCNEGDDYITELGTYIDKHLP